MRKKEEEEEEGQRFDCGGLRWWYLGGCSCIRLVDSWIC